MTSSKTGIARKVSLHSLREAACKGHIVKAATKIALVVGTALTLIRQSPGIVASDSIYLWRLPLVYLVPDWVTRNSAPSNDLRRRTCP